MARFTVLAAALALFGSAEAQEGGGRKGNKEGGAGRGAPAAGAATFAQLDANGDGVVSKAEILEFFTKLDANKDGNVSREEFTKAAPAAAPKQGEGGARKGGEGDGGARPKGGEGQKD